MQIINGRTTDAGVVGFISGHSLRVGSVVSLAKAGASCVVNGKNTRLFIPFAIHQPMHR